MDGESVLHIIEQRTRTKDQEFPLLLAICIDTPISNFTICIFFWEVFIEDRIINLHIAL